MITFVSGWKARGDLRHGFMYYESGSGRMVLVRGCGRPNIKRSNTEGSDVVAELCEFDGHHTIYTPVEEIHLIDLDNTMHHSQSLDSSLRYSTVVPKLHPAQVRKAAVVSSVYISLVRCLNIDKIIIPSSIASLRRDGRAVEITGCTAELGKIRTARLSRSSILRSNLKVYLMI